MTTIVAPTEVHPDEGIERVRELYAMLRGLPKRAINLKNWRHDPKPYSNGTSDKELLAAGIKAKENPRHHCGTVACAVGWACAYPEFTKEGLSYTMGQPAFNGITGWEAVAEFFQMPRNWAEFLFMPETSYFGFNWPSAKASQEFRRKPTESHLALVLRRIRFYLLERGAIDRYRYVQLAKEEKAGLK